MQFIYKYLTTEKNTYIRWNDNKREKTQREYICLKSVQEGQESRRNNEF